MQKILKLTGVSMLAIMTASGANAAGYTCEELIEYTSCNPGYWLSTTTSDNRCPDGYTYSKTWTIYDGSPTEEVTSNNECTDDFYCNWLGEGCFYYVDEDREELEDNGDPVNCMYDASEYLDICFVEANLTAITSTSQCNECPAGSSCAGGTAGAVACAAGTYQPEKKQTTCISAPVGNYVADTGATSYIACPVSGLTDANGNVVSVTTESTGATSSSACFVAKGTEFKDNKGTYHFTENCSFDFWVASIDGTCPEGYVYIDENDIMADSEASEGIGAGCFKIPAGREDCSSWYYEDDGTYGDKFDISQLLYCNDDL